MEENQSFLELQVDQEAAANLNEVSRWSKFLAFLVIIGIGLIFLVFIILWNQIAGAFMVLDDADGKNMNIVRIGMIVVFIIVIAIVGILMNFLIKGANRIRAGIRNRDQVLFNNGLANLRNYFTMYGVLAILGLFFALIGLLNQ